MSNRKDLLCKGNDNYKDDCEAKQKAVSLIICWIMIFWSLVHWWAGRKSAWAGGAFTQSHMDLLKADPDWQFVGLHSQAQVTGLKYCLLGHDFIFLHFKAHEGKGYKVKIELLKHSAILG